MLPPLSDRLRVTDWSDSSGSPSLSSIEPAASSSSSVAFTGLFSVTVNVSPSSSSSSSSSVATLIVFVVSPGANSSVVLGTAV